MNHPGHSTSWTALAWGGPPTRYWIDHPEVQRRLVILRERQEAAGFLNMGQAHVIGFGELVS